MSDKPAILIFAPSVNGGIAEHTFYQARALAQAGARITCLVAPSFLAGRTLAFATEVCLNDPPREGGWRLRRHFILFWHLLADRWRLAWHVWQARPDLVLLDSYVEYFSPFWIWPHWLLARLRHTRYAANLHDPVRDHRVGPAWWHGLSVRLAYLPLKFVLVHHQLPEPSPVPKRVKVCEVPVGVYEVTPGTLNPRTLRNDWQVPAGARVFLAFGYIRDNKNLDLVMKAMAGVPGVFLVVAGRESSSHSRPLKYYRDLAASLGIADRVRFFDQFIADNEVAAYYAAADFIVLTYAASFVSQSAVLNVAARLTKPVLASSGPGPLRNSVERFGLGVFVEPDSVPAIARGLRRLLAGDIPAPAWENYLAYASWRTNAAAILAELREPGAATLSPLPGSAGLNRPSHPFSES